MACYPWHGIHMFFTKKFTQLAIIFTVCATRLSTLCCWHSIFICVLLQTSAAQAILKIDGLKMGESTVSVAISNPPARNAPMSERENSFLPSLGGGKTETE